MILGVFFDANGHKPHALAIAFFQEYVRSGKESVILCIVVHKCTLKSAKVNVADMARSYVIYMVTTRTCTCACRC